jgi:hypothetical protein
MPSRLTNLGVKLILCQLNGHFTVFELLGTTTEDHFGLPMESEEVLINVIGSWLFPIS